MKRLVAMIAACLGAPGLAAEAAPSPPTYAGAPGRTDLAGLGASDGWSSITNLAPLDAGLTASPTQRLGVRLAGADQTGGAAPSSHRSKSTAPASSGPGSHPKGRAIYGHNVEDVIIGKLGVKPSTAGGKPGPGPKKVIIYNGTITSEPTQALGSKTAGNKTPAGGASKAGSAK